MQQRAPAPRPQMKIIKKNSRHSTIADSLISRNKKLSLEKAPIKYKHVRESEARVALVRKRRKTQKQKMILTLQKRYFIEECFSERQKKDARVLK